MFEHFVPDDREGSDNELHRKIMKEILKPPDTADDKTFTKDDMTVYLKKKLTRKIPLNRMD